MYEIQFHPADIRKQVRYYFLGRKGFRRLVAGGVVAAAVLTAGLVLAPLGIQSLLLAGRLHSLDQQHRLHHEVLEQRTLTLNRLERDVASARALQRQMGLILGAPQGSEGPGGYPEPPPGDLLVPEAQLAVRRGLKLDSDTKALLTLADELASFARSNDDLAQAVPSICPLPVGTFVLTSPFGNRTSPFTNTVDFHSGLDLAAHEGTPILAAGGGRVVFAGRYPLRRNVRWWRYGNVVVLAHGERYLTIYAHLQEISVRRGSDPAERRRDRHRRQHWLEYVTAPPLRSSSQGRKRRRAGTGGSADLYSQLPVDRPRGTSGPSTQRPGAIVRPTAVAHAREVTPWKRPKTFPR